MLALDVARLEAGFILLEVDYIGVEKALNPSQNTRLLRSVWAGLSI